MVHYQHNQNILLLFKDHKENFVLSLHYNGNNRLLFLNTTKIHQFKAKKKLWNKTIFIVFRKYLKKKSQLITWKKRGFNGYIYDFSVDYNINNTSYIINIHKNLMKKDDIK